jgi:putative transposase
LFGVELKETSKRRRKVCYARVSSAKQHTDLDRQIEDLKREFPEHEISSKTLEVVSTSKEKDLKPWWTQLCQEISKNLSSVTKTDCVDLDIQSSNKFVKSLSAKSWFNLKMTMPIQQKTWPMTYYPLLQSLQQNTTDKEQQKKENAEVQRKKKKLNQPTKKEKEKKLPAQKCKKIKLYPNEEEHETLSQWMGCARWTYNQCLDGIKNHNISRNKKALRAYCINESAEIVQQNTWCLNVPYDVRNEGMNDLLKAYKTCIASKKKFEIKFKSKKDRKDSIVIHSKHYTQIRGQYSFIKRMKSSEKLPLKIDYDARLIRDKLN